MRTILHNCGEIAHLSTGDDEDPLSGERLLDRESLVHPAGMAIMIRGGIIEKIAPSEEVLSEFAPWYPSESTSGEVDVIDIGEMSVVPGFVDSHTHLPWSGDRTNELAMRLRGKTYQEIAQSGGGIMKTVMHTRSKPKRHLVTS